MNLETNRKTSLQSPKIGQLKVNFLEYLEKKTWNEISKIHIACLKQKANILSENINEL